MHYGCNETRMVCLFYFNLSALQYEDFGPFGCDITQSMDNYPLETEKCFKNLFKEVTKY